MKSVILGALSSVLVAALLVPTAEAGLSAKRADGAAFKTYLRAAQVGLMARGGYISSHGVLDEKGKFADANWARVPTLTASDMQSTFEVARDLKPFDDSFSSRKKKRRASWLYPDDGCFVRAVIAADTVEQLASMSSAKIFAFGDLTVQTDNSPSGAVSWWYHVAAISKVVESGVEKFYVHDPAIDPKKPMEVTKWLAAMNAPDAEIAICAGATYDPDSDCALGDTDSMQRAHGEAPGYLGAEWYQLERMGRDPVRELGDFPPWL